MPFERAFDTVERFGRLRPLLGGFMADLDLRPLSLGEILDRTFTLYRKHFLLFAGITAIPQLLVLALRLAQTLFMTSPAARRNLPVEQLQAGNPKRLFSVWRFLVIRGVIL